MTLVASFFAIALLYAIVGFGGGSSYTALLAVTDIPYHLVPKVSLACNLLVVSGGCYQYFRRGLLDWRLVGPFVLSSIPFALLGGVYPIKERTFMVVLSSSLFLAGFRILFIKDHEGQTTQRPSLRISLAVGAVLGLLSGVVGIGGGIFLSPLMLNLRWAKAKEVAAVASCFIFLNSIAGLVGQFIKSPAFLESGEYLPLFAAVVLGGQIGSRVGTHPRLSHLWVQRCTGLLILFVSARLFTKLMFEM